MSEFSFASEKVLNICDLNDYVLDYIFQFLFLEDLDCLVQVCKRFFHVVNVHTYAKKSAHLLLTGHRWKFTGGRDVSNSDYRKRIRLFENWRYGKYRESQLFYHQQVYFSMILLDESMLYMTHRGVMRAHPRTKRDNVVQRKATWTLGRNRDPDINWVVKKGHTFFGGLVDGTCFTYNDQKPSYNRQFLMEDIITAVDFEDDLFVCTTKSRSTTFWNRYEEMGQNVLKRKRKLDDAYQTISLSPGGATHLAAGKYHDREKNALKLIDVETGETETLNSPTRAVYHVLWKDNNTLLTGNFDTTFRMVDTRTSKDQAVWTDPYDASVYCLHYDGSYGVLCGMKYNFRVNLYDIRMPKRCIQMYFSSKKRSHYSPVYSLAADSSQLFLVTDHDLRVLDFDVNMSERKDYTHDLVKWLY
ncbi:F-box/WD repeat-containing protein 4 [Toxorhynchites rutilus septentrionalis]|uniref:F-box/WD repeat-containing protein 4 n=1 Tax=Toxorhynchites rutilus septentrionalis TaxID=329112 RepID=UPI00247A6EED|nr:F-box/WD repeat-containing protein 4 [Toxorhynchites rutilus septentrionalis]